MEHVKPVLTSQEYKVMENNVGQIDVLNFKSFQKLENVFPVRLMQEYKEMVSNVDLIRVEKDKGL